MHIVSKLCLPNVKIWNYCNLIKELAMMHDPNIYKLKEHSQLDCLVTN